MEVNQEESLISGINFDKGFVTEETHKNLNDFDNSWDQNCGTGNSHNYREGKTEKMSEDIVDLLPRDPFGMDISATVTAITEWIEDFGLKNLGFESGEDEDENDYKALAKLIVWNSAPTLHPNVSNVKLDRRSTESSMEFDSGLYDGPLLLDGDIENFIGFSFDKYCTPPDRANKHQGCTKDNIDGAPGPPPDALFFALGCLGVRDLLSVERVCKSMRDAVQNDPLLWRNIDIDYQLSYKISDDDLLRLTKRAQGSLDSLSLVRCLKITDNGLKQVLESNPGLIKLNVAGCVRLSIEGILGNLKFLKSVGRPGIKLLRIGGRYGITSQHFKELKFLLGVQDQQQHRAQKPRFRRAGQLYLSFDDEREIDIETCPRCQRIMQVYDCPADSCRGNMQTVQACRACTLCISRCENCGRCLSNYDYEETFCLELICLDCWKQKSMKVFPKQIYHNQQASYHFFLYG